MNRSEELSELIDKYLLGKITEKELNMLHKELSSNPELAADVALEQDILAGIQQYGNRELKQRLKVMHQNVIAQKPPQAKIRRIGFSPIAIAASVLILIAAGVWWMNQSASVTTEQLLADHYVPNSNLVSGVRGANGGATSLYKLGNYQAALPLFTALIADTTEAVQKHKHYYQFAQYTCLYETGKTEAALQGFKDLHEQGIYGLSDYAAWYAALLHLKLGQNEEATTLLNELASDAGKDQHEEAIQLLEDMKNLK